MHKHKAHILKPKKTPHTVSQIHIFTPYSDTYMKTHFILNCLAPRNVSDIHEVWLPRNSGLKGGPKHE